MGIATVPVDGPAEKAAATYNAAADHYDEAPLAFWQRHGARLVALLDLKPGERVLDVGCGTGATTLPAATAVGPSGHVLGLDVAANMLARAERKACRQGLSNVTFMDADMAACELPDAPFDAVVSAFSLFFVPDMERQLGELWRLVRPGGRLALSTWAEDAFRPQSDLFGSVLRSVKTDMPVTTRPWERLADAAGLKRLFADAGVAEPAVHVIEDRQVLLWPEDWWTIAMGSGFRGEIEQLSMEQHARVRERVVGRLSKAGLTVTGSGALYALAQKSAAL